MPNQVDEDDTQEMPAYRDNAARRLAHRLTGTRRARLVTGGVATLGIAAVISLAAPTAHHSAGATTSSFGGRAPQVAPVSPTPSPSGDTALGPAASPSTGASSKASTTPAKPSSPRAKPSTPPSKKSRKRPTPPTPKPATPGAASSNATRTSKAAWVTPMRNFRLTSCYGTRWGSQHQGIDFADHAGTPILAAAAGTVVTAGWNSSGYGNIVIIKHSAHVFTLYGNSSKLLVHAGQKVKAGQRISLEGGTGHVTGPHLHFEVWTSMWHRIEPAKLLRRHGVRLNRC